MAGAATHGKEQNSILAGARITNSSGKQENQMVSNPIEQT
jgi:hypothetical protein